MLQKPLLERVVGNDNNTATPKTAHEKCKNIATKTENTFKVSKEGVSAESSSSLSAPEKSQFTCESDQIKKNQDTEVTKHLRPDEHTKKLNSEKQGLACGSSSGQESVERFVKIVVKIFGFPISCFAQLPIHKVLTTSDLFCNIVNGYVRLIFT